MQCRRARSEGEFNSSQVYPLSLINKQKPPSEEGADFQVVGKVWAT